MFQTAVDIVDLARSVISGAWIEISQSDGAALEDLHTRFAAIWHPASRNDPVRKNLVGIDSFWISLRDDGAGR